MDPGPRTIDIYPSFSSPEGNRKFLSWAYLMCTRYSRALQMKGWRRSKKLNIHLTLEPDDTVHLSGGIIHVYYPFDYASYLSAELAVQQLMIREVIHQATLRCSRHMDWPKEALEHAYSNTAATATHLVMESKLIRSPDRLHYASVVGVLNHQCTLITVRFRDRSKKIVNEAELITSFQDPLFYGTLLQRREWHSNDIFGIGISSGELWITASVDKTTSNVQLLPSTNSVEELQGMLRCATFREFSSDADYVAWANQ